MSVQDKIMAFIEGQPLPEPTECVAVPESDAMIDVLHPLTGKTVCYTKTLEQVRAEPGYEQAERMTIEAWLQQKAARQHSPISWTEVSQDRYDDMFEVLPPIVVAGKGFLVSEPWDHDASTGQPRYAAYRDQHGRCEIASRPLTVHELRES